MKSGESIYNLNTEVPVEAEGAVTEEAPTEEIKPESAIESMSARESGAFIRERTVEAIKSASSRFSRMKNSFFSGVRRIAGLGAQKSVGVLDTVVGGTAKGVIATGQGIGRGAEMVGNGVEVAATVVANTPEWLIDKTADGLTAASEQLDRGAAWTMDRISDTGDFVGEKYVETKEWAGKKAFEIQQKGEKIQEGLNRRVDSARAWKDIAVGQFREMREKHQAIKLRLELERVTARKAEIEQKLNEVSSIGDLMANIG